MKLNNFKFFINRFSTLLLVFQASAAFSLNSISKPQLTETSLSHESPNHICRSKNKVQIDSKIQIQKQNFSRLPSNLQIGQISIQETIQQMNQDPDAFIYSYIYTHHPLRTAGATLGIIGDSLATGIVASPTLRVSYSSILTHLITSNALRLINYFSVYYPERPQYDPGQDSPLLSFGQIVARTLNIGSYQIMNVAVDGQRISQMDKQLLFLGEVNEKRFGVRALPDIVFSSFNANDICDPNIFDKTLDNIKLEYKQGLIDNYKKLAQWQASSKGTDFFVISNLNFVNVLTNSDVLKKQISVREKNLSCSQLRNPNIDEEQRDTIDKLIGMCRGVLSINLNDKNKIQYLSLIYQQLLSSHKEAAEESKASLLTHNIRLHLIESTPEIQYKGEDIANDCFHPSFKGHIKIASKILNEGQEIFKKYHF